jgi:hypothetical protein
MDPIHILALLLSGKVENIKERISERDIECLCTTAKGILMEESNVRRLSSPITVSVISTLPSTLIFIVRFVGIFTDNIMIY